MATGVNVKMGVSGVAQFKQNINQAKQSVKTLDAQLALTEKQFKASGDAESYMTEKTELLKAKLEAQKGVLAQAEKALDDMAKNGVDRASKSYQDMYRQMLSAKGELLDTENALNNVASAGESAANEVSGMNNQLQSINRNVSFDNLSEGIEGITSKMESAAKKAWALGEALVRNVLGAGSWADELKTTADQYKDTLLIMSGGGSTTEYLQRMRKTATLIDTDVDTILDAQDKLAKNNSKQSKEYMGALAFLGIDNTGKDNLDLFWEAGDAIAKLGKDADKTYYAQQIFGRSWRELLPLFRAGREEYEKTNESWNVLEEDQVDALGKMDDSYQKMQGEWETFKTELLSAFSGPLTEGMDAITGLFQELNKYLDTEDGQAMLSQLGETISGLIKDLTEIDPAEVVGGLKGVIDGITDALKWINDNHELVVGAMGAIVGGWGLLKLTGGVLDVLKIVNAITGLTTAGEAAAAGASAGSSWAGAFASAAMKAAPFLAFLYTLLNPSGGGDEIGNNTLIDENGQATGEADAYGIRVDENGNAHNTRTDAAAGRKYSEYQEQKIQELWDLYRKGNLGKDEFNHFRGASLLDDEQYNDLMQSLYTFTQDTPAWRDLMDLPDEFFRNGQGEGTGNTLTSEDLREFHGMPAAVAEAVSKVGFTVTLEGQQLLAYIDAHLGNKTMGE